MAGESSLGQGSLLTRREKIFFFLGRGKELHITGQDKFPTGERGRFYVLPEKDRSSSFFGLSIRRIRSEEGRENSCQTEKIGTLCHRRGRSLCYPKVSYKDAMSQAFL